MPFFMSRVIMGLVCIGPRLCAGCHAGAKGTTPRRVTMRNRSRRGTWQEALKNLRQPGSLGHKLRLFIRNNWIKVRTRSACCGHYGEPGC